MGRQVQMASEKSTIFNHISERVEDSDVDVDVACGSIERYHFQRPLVTPNYPKPSLFVNFETPLLSLEQVKLKISILIWYID